MKACLALLAALLVPERAEACAIKHNELVVVLGVIDRDVVTVRIALHEADGDVEMAASTWSGSAKLAVGAGPAVAFGSFVALPDASAELDRLIALARTAAGKLPRFVPAFRVAAKDCTENPTTTCGDIALVNSGTELRLGSRRSPLAVTLADVEPANLEITGVVRYKAGKTEIAVINVGSGDPRFATSLRTCDGGPCRTVTTLHHGNQQDVVVVVRS